MQIKRIAVFGVVALVSAGMSLFSSGSALAAGTAVIYDSIPSPLPPNLISYGAQPAHFDELGDEVSFAGTSRTLNSVIVTMSSQACQVANGCTTTPGSTFTEPITFNIYAVGDGFTPGPLLATDTQTFNIPYRPSADPTDCGNSDWYDASTGGCYTGLAVNITFNFSSQNVTLPNSVIYGISYNTTTFGYQPYGTNTTCFNSGNGCPYDSLNVGLDTTGPPSVGTKVDPDTLYQNSPSTGPDYYCDSGAAGTGFFRVDSPTNQCWGAWTPAVEFLASVPGGFVSGGTPAQQSTHWAGTTTYTGFTCTTAHASYAGQQYENNTSSPVNPGDVAVPGTSSELDAPNGITMQCSFQTSERPPSNQFWSGTTGCVDHWGDQSTSWYQTENTSGLITLHCSFPPHMAITG